MIPSGLLSGSTSLHFIVRAKFFRSSGGRPLVPVILYSFSPLRTITIRDRLRHLVTVQTPLSPFTPPPGIYTN